MTLSRKAWVLVITLAVSFSTGAGVTRENPLFDRYGPITLAAEKKRLRNYAVQIKNAPASRGVIIVYAGDPWSETAAKARGRRAYNHLIRNEGIDPKRLQWRYGGVCSYGNVLLYVLWPEQVDPVPDTACKR